MPEKGCADGGTNQRSDVRHRKSRRHPQPNDHPPAGFVSPFSKPVPSVVHQLTSGFRYPTSENILRKEVIQPQVPLRLPCYDFTPVADLTVVGCLPKVSAPASGKTNSHGVTGGVYKARERIHRGMLIRDY